MVVEIESFLSNYCDKNIVFIPNSGNAGDALIAYATFQVFERLGIHYEVGDLAQTYENRVILFGGGGNLVEPYKNAIKFIDKHKKHAREIVILPHTVRCYAPVLSELGEKGSIICRDFASMEYCKSNITGGVRLYLSDDMAFSISVEKLFSDGARARNESGKQFLIRNTKRLLREKLYGLKNLLTPSVLNAFRMDVEKTGVQVPFNNIDVSQSHSLEKMEKMHISDCVYSMFRFIDKFDVVNTNRLHVCISGLLLGKKVNFYDNSYGKNHDVYKKSMKGNFDNLVWKG